MEYVKLLGDVSFNAPALQNGKYNLGGMKTDKTFWSPDWLTGADHTEELNILFSGTCVTGWDKALSDRMITYRTKFAKSG